MVFLQHRKAILQQIRDQATTAAFLRRERHFRARKWIQLLHASKISRGALDNYAVRKVKIKHHQWQIACAQKIRKRLTI